MVQQLVIVAITIVERFAFVHHILLKVLISLHNLWIE